MRRVLLILGFTLALSWAQNEVETEVHAEWIFETETDDGFATSVIVGPDTTIYIGSYDGYIYALSPEGGLKWKYTPFKSGIDASRILRPAIGLDGNILITSNSTLYVLTPDGDIVWDYDTKGSWYTCPAIDSRGNVYVGGGKTLFSLTSDGEIRWKHKSKGNIDAQSVTPDGSIYFWSHDGYLNALNTEGEVIWRYETEDSMEYFPAVGPDKTVYFGAKNGYFYALNPEGELKWKFQTGDEIWSTPAITEDGTIYFGSKDNYLYALTSEGKLKWKYKTGDDIRWSKPLIAHDGTVIIGSWDGYLYGLTPKGKLRYRYKASTGIDFSPALIDSTIYFSSGNMLYALKVSTIERYADTDSTIPDKLTPQAPVVTGGAGLARVADARTPEVNTWTFGTSFAGDRHGADHMNDWNISTWENAVFRAFVAWVPLDKLEINAAAGLGYTYLADTGDLQPRTGLWDAEAGVEYEFLKRPAGNVAAAANIFIPLRDSVFGGPRLGGGAGLLASLSSRDIKGLRMHANLGTEYLEDVGLTWGLGIEYHIAILNPYLEFTGEVESGGTPIRVTPGFRIITDFGLSAYYAADFGLNLAARSIDLRGRDYVDQVSAGIAFSY